MTQKQAEEILLQIKNLCEKHIINFSASSYLIDSERIDHLFQLLYTADTEAFEDSNSWKRHCSEVLQLNDKLKVIVGGKMLEMNRIRNMNYNSMNKVEAFYIDRKG
ncbi:hypothetical protein RB298_12980 [Priestia sp. BR_2]